MPLPTPYPGGSAFTPTNLNTFIPELWISEIIRSRNEAMVMKNYVKRIPEQMLKGDVVHVPSVGRLSVNPKIAETPVTLQTGTPTEFTFMRDRYIESSFMVEDIAALQTSDMYDAMRIYTEEAGIALARDIDSWILAHRTVIKAAGRVITGGANLTLANLLAAKTSLLNLNVPTEDLVFVCSPAQLASLLDIDKVANQFYVTGRPIESGTVGRLYDIEVMSTSAIRRNATTGFRIGDTDPTGPTPGVAFWSVPNTRAEYSRYYPDAAKLLPWTAAQKVGGQHTLVAPTSGTAGDTLAIGAYSAILCHKDWLALWMAEKPKVESSREVLFQGDAVVTTQYYGAKVFRNDAAVIIETTEVA